MRKTSLLSHQAVKNSRKPTSGPPCPQNSRKPQLVGLQNFQNLNAGSPKPPKLKEDLKSGSPHPRQFADNTNSGSTNHQTREKNLNIGNACVANIKQMHCQHTYLCMLATLKNPMKTSQLNLQTLEIFILNSNRSRKSNIE